ncbi:hypothetical protein ACWDSF_06255 [Nocardia beijingensis]
MKYWLARYLRRWADHLVPPAPPIAHMEAVKIPASYAIVFHDKVTGEMFGCCGKHALEDAEGQ